jgi:hypothetical protein
MRTETDLNHGTLPDPVVQAIQGLREEVASLRKRLDQAEARAAGKRKAARKPGRHTQSKKRQDG